MNGNRDLIVAKLELIAAKAKLLAMNVRDGKTWPGDLAAGAGELATVSREVCEAAREDR